MFISTRAKLGKRKVRDEEKTFWSCVEDFLATSSIHGLGQLSKSRCIVSHMLWLIIVTSGFFLTVFMVYLCSQGWQENPITTSVVQIPIEHIVFPPVTLCPIGKSQGDEDDNTDDDIPEKTEIPYDTLKSSVIQCNFTKNNVDTGKVCDRIQEIFNENGLCLTVNNVDISLNTSGAPVKVAGVGYKNSLRLTMNSTVSGVPVKYRVFISEPGTTVSKVFFDVDPVYQGDQTFHLHGIHYVQAGANFRAWNEDTETCYFHEQRKLRYFTSYMQDNCKRECSWNKSISVCGCAPRSFHLDNVVDCGQEGMRCWAEDRHSITEEEEAICNCKNDCEMTHFFFSLIKDPSLKPVKPRPFIFYFDTHIITQVNLELKHTFFDKISAIGGTLGLFCGVSVISIVELVFYFVQLIKQMFMRKRKETLTQIPIDYRIFSHDSPDVIK